jgi:hypothetical protein
MLQPLPSLLPLLCLEQGVPQLLQPQQQQMQLHWLLL